MRLTKFTCPHCEATLKNPNGAETGKRIRCPKCHEPFAVTTPDDAEEEERAPVRSSAARPTNKARRLSDDLDEDDVAAAEQSSEAPPRKKKGKKGKKQNKEVFNLLPFLIIGGCVLVAGVATGLYFLFHKKPADTSPSAPVS